ncbi:MAG: FAD-dependent oxidoreductase [Microcoleus sp. SIO2G3]|nr:FAD-dependent oxidoreductase [Microcoleus sp. SIO2G3]
MFDVAIIGAGLAGLTCAQQLHQAGYSVVVIEKSRGVGGRLATRRLHDTRADHGVRYLESQGKLVQQLIEILLQRNILQTWTTTTYELDSGKPESGVGSELHPSAVTSYVAPTGMTAVAKVLATGLDIRLNRRVQAMVPTEKAWQLTLEPTDEQPSELMAKAVVVATPAPQALMILEPLEGMGLPSVFLDSLRSVEFDPCLSAIALYPAQREKDLVQLNPAWKSITLTHDPDLAWIGLDSSKRLDTSVPIFVLQSTPKFANRYLDATDLQSAGQQMLSRAAQLLMPWLDTPESLQVHRWRYAFPQRSLPTDYLAATTPLPVICCGDWCGGNRIESALHSGLAAATQMNHQLQQRSLPRESFWDAV